MNNYFKIKVFNLYGGSGAVAFVTDSMIRQQAENAAIHVKHINPDKTFDELMWETQINFSETPGFNEEVVSSDFDRFMEHFDNKLRELFRPRREMDRSRREMDRPRREMDH